MSRIIFVSLCILLLTVFINSNALVPIPDKYFTQKELKQLKNADILKKRADTVLSNVRLKKGTDKKTNNSFANNGGELSSNELNSYRKAFAYRKKANATYYSIYNRKLKDIRKETDIDADKERVVEGLVKEAKKYNNAANQLRNQINDAISLTESLKLRKEALSREQIAIKKVKQAITIILKTKDNYEALQVAKNKVQPSGNNAVINESLLRNILLSLDKSKMGDDMLSRYRKLINSDTAGAEAMRMVISQYRNESQTNKAKSSEKLITYNNNSDNSQSKTNTSSSQVKATKEQFSSNENNSPDADLNYHVQLSARENKIPKNKYDVFFPENENINVKKEDSLYKYIVRSFNSYKRAFKYKMSMDFEDGFITAYKDDRPIDIIEAISITDPEYYSQLMKGYSPVFDRDTIFFKVQIIATENVLSRKQISSIYDGKKEVDVIHQEGVYRYSIGQCPTYEAAKSLSDNIPVDDAFVVAYKGRKKLPIDKAREAVPNSSVTIKPLSEAASGNPVYRIQIAVFEDPLNDRNAQQLLCVNSVIYKKQTNKNYVYLVGSYESFKSALKKQKQMCALGTNIVQTKSGEIRNSNITKKIQ